MRQRSRKPVERSVTTGALDDIALRARALTKRFGGTLALDSLDLDVRRGEIHGLVGENGSGKSTFIKILSGLHVPNSGTVQVHGQDAVFGSPAHSFALGCRFVHQDLGLIDSLSVLDNLLITSGFPTTVFTVRRREAMGRAQRDLASVGLDVDPRSPVGTLPPAVKTGVALARALSTSATRPALLVLDEPTATLPYTEVDSLLAIMRTVAKSGVGVLFVTHRLDELFDIADNVTILRDGRAVVTRPVASLDRRTIVEFMIGTELDEVRASSMALPLNESSVALEVSHVSAGSVSDLTFQARAGEITGIAGLTGSGSEAALPAVFGSIARRGQVAVNGTTVPPSRPDRAIALGVAYLPGERQTLGALESLSARENLTIADLGPLRRLMMVRRGKERAETRDWFTRLSIRPVDVEQPINLFSGGNQQKIIISRWLRRRPTVFLLDEPTQGVDIASKTEIHRQLLTTAQQGSTVVVRSSDLDELLALSHVVIVIRNGRVAARLMTSGLTIDELVASVLGVDAVEESA